MFSPNSGRLWAKYSAAAAQAAKVTFMKSGERPIMPQVVRAQRSIIARAALQLVLGARDDEGESQALAAGRRDEGHLVAQLRVVLQVVQRRDRPRPVGETGVRGDVLDALAAQPDLALLRL